MGKREYWREYSTPPVREAIDSMVGFLDILGFKALTNRYIDDPAYLNHLDTLLERESQTLGGGHSINENITYRMFSDCICAACPISDKNVIDFVFILTSP